MHKGRSMLVTKAEFLEIVAAGIVVNVIVEYIIKKK